MSTVLAQQILDALCRRQPQAALVTEVAAALRPPRDPGQIEEALRDLGHQGRVLVMDHNAPDIHLTSADLRVVACIADADGERGAIEAADTVWSEWLRAFLSSHRCQ